MSLRELARRLSMTHTVLSKWERGLAAVDADQLPVIGVHLRVDPCVFLREEAAYPEASPAEGRVAEARQRMLRDYLAGEMGLEDDAAEALANLARLIERRQDPDA